MSLQTTKKDESINKVFSKLLAVNCGQKLVPNNCIMKMMRAGSCCLMFWLFLSIRGFNTEDPWTSDDFEVNVDNLLSNYQSERQESFDDQKSKEECNTPACKSLKDFVQSTMSTKYRPCDDMYMYSCGGMIEREKKRTPEHSNSTFRMLIQAQTKKLIKVVEGLKDRKENDAYKKVYDWYAACSNTEEKKKLGRSPLLKVLKSSGSWPLLNEFWDEYDWDLEETLAFMNRELAVFPLIGITLDNDSRNVSGTPLRLAITNPDLGLSATEFYLKKTKYSDKILFAYFQLLCKLNELIGATGTCSLQEFNFYDENLDNYQEGLVKDVLEVVKFEMDLAKARSLAKGTCLVCRQTTLGDLQRRYGMFAFDWKRYIRLLYQGIPSQPPFYDDEIIYTLHPKVLDEIMQLIERTQPRVLANYIMSNVLFEYAGTLSPEFREPYKQFYTAAYGIKTFSPLNVRCIHSVSKDLMFAVTALFVKDNLPENELVKAEQLVNRLTEAYLDHLDADVQWMDSNTRNAAKKKVKMMMAHVGYPRIIRNMTVLDNIYKHVRVDPLKYFENVKGLSQVQIISSFEKRGKYPKRDEWDMQLTTANAQYSASKNMITVGAGLLQPPLFHLDYPRARTFGSIGMAIGHEMTHGFDAYGSRFDENGNVHSWWTKKTHQKFKNRTECMVKEYSKFKVYNEHIHGRQTLDENIADNGGIRIAYEAYCTSLKFDGPDQSLPGINLTQKQLFFLSFGQLWCKHKPRASAINSLHTDVHSPAKARVNVVLQNMKEFAETFNCPKGSPMNPEKKCVVW